MKSACLLICLLVLSGLPCKAQIKFALREKQDLVKYLQEHSVKYDMEDLYVLKDVNVFIDYLKKEMVVVPSAYFFNKDGFRVSKKYKGDRCSQVITDPEKINKVSYDENDPVINWLKEYTSLSNSSNESFNRLDGYIIIFWATILDEESNIISFNWYKSLKQNTLFAMKPILVNLDLQSDWKLTDLHKEAFGLQ